MKREILITDRTLKAFAEYLHEQEKSTSTIQSYQRELFSLKMYLDEGKVTKEKLIDYKAMIATQYKPSSCNVAISAINSFLKYINRTDLCIKPLKIQKQIFENRNRKLTKGDYEKLIKAANINGQETLSLIIQTICSTGIRVSELQYITIESLKSGQALINNKGKNRIVFIPKTLITILKRYVINSNVTAGPIFTTRTGKPIDRSNIWAAMKRLCTIANVNPEKVYPHNLRHLFARSYYSQYKDLSRLCDLLGHTSVNTTKIYTKESGAIHIKQIEGLGLVRDTT